MKYSKIDIRNTVRNLIDYFKMQNEVPSQKEIVEVWSKIKEGVEKKKQRRKERYILVAITSAAAFIGCIWLGIEWYSFNNKSDISVIAAQMSNESIEGEDIRLIVSEKEVHHVKKGATVAYSQEGIVSVDEEKEISSKSIVQRKILFYPGKIFKDTLADMSITRRAEIETDYTDGSSNGGNTGGKPDSGDDGKGEGGVTPDPAV